MPISVQQFDFIAATQGINEALRMAEQAGGVVGTRDGSTQMELGAVDPERSYITGQLTGQGGEYMPGTVVTDTSQGIGAAGSATSGDILGGGGSATGVTSLGGRSIVDIMNMYQGDTSNIPANAPAVVPAAAGSNMVHAYWGPGSRQAGEYVGLVSAADAAFANYEVRPGPPVAEPAVKPAATVSRDQQILDSVMAGTIIELSRLAEISDLVIREKAANELAKLLVKGLGNTQASVQELGKIYTQFIDYVGNEALNFDDWTTLAGLDWSQVPKPGSGVASVDITGTTQVYFSDGTAQRVNDSELPAFLAENPGTTTDPDKYEGGPFVSPGGRQDLPQRSPNDQDIFEFLGGFYAQHQNDPAVWTVTLKAAAQRIVDSGITVGGQKFDNTNDAYNFFQKWAYSPTGGNISAGGIQDWIDYAAGVTTPAGTTSFTPSGTITEEEGGGLNLQGMYQFGSPESLRTFGSIYPGFTSLLPGYNTSPAVSSALRSSQDPMNIQFLARQAMTPGMAVPANEAEASAAASQWLQNINAGTQGLMQGSNYANFLNQLSNVLTGTPGAPVNVGGVPMDTGVRTKLEGTFGDPTSQMQAFMNPFYRSTAGSPEMRDALLGQIQQAAQRYQYQEPSGAFLPWALEQNVGGIQSILPSLQGFGTPGFGTPGFTP